MTAIIRNHNNQLVQVDTETDVIFAEDSSYPWYYYFYHKTGNAFYAARREINDEYAILKIPHTDIANLIHGANTINQTITELFIESINENI